jgi:hypothetical protein
VAVAFPPPPDEHAASPAASTVTAARAARFRVFPLGHLSRPSIPRLRCWRDTADRDRPA